MCVFICMGFVHFLTLQQFAFILKQLQSLYIKDGADSTNAI